ncbi:MAG: putative transport protein [bacterium P3]|nr:MAG: putative transport protein [bacterium P3]KWW42014.1 MAG: putative transport protein [bacterium F083]
MLSFFTGSGVGPAIFYLAVAVFAGLWIGRFKLRGVTLGITWVLFVGLLLSAVGVSLNHDMLHLAKELGLILFVTAVGLQVGPGFFRSFRKGGLAMNLMALVNVALGVGITVLIARLAGQDLTDMAGVYTGAVTNTPALSAAQQAAADMGEGGTAERLAAGYAVAYPLAVVGMIAACLLLRPRNLAGVPSTLADEPPVVLDKQATPTSQRHKVHLIPIFIIIASGVLIGSIPVSVGMKAPLKLGLAGGPLVVALIVGWLGVRKGWLTQEFTDSHGVWMLRETGIALFLAGVGLSAGADFVQTVRLHYIWVLYGVLITMLPPLLLGLFGRFVLKMNYYTLMGFIGGSHTDPPTLAFANTVAPEGCKLPNIGYATVYPLTMLLRIFTAQLLVLL